jgi:hypothetical protein
MRWIALVLLLSGCSATRTKVTVTRVYGEPVISIEFCGDNDGYKRPLTTAACRL